MADAPLRPDQYDRYRRHLTLPEIGLEGQQALLAARVLLVGAGGLGASVRDGAGLLEQDQQARRLSVAQVREHFECVATRASRAA